MQGLAAWVEPREQGAGQRREARTDLDHAIARARCHGAGNRLDH